MHGARKHILDHLHAHGESTVAELARVTGLAPVTVRHHMAVLRERCLVELNTRAAGRGRPCHRYRLSGAGERSLDDDRALAALASDMLAAMKAAPGDGGLCVLRDVAAEGSRAHAEAVAGEPTEVRVRAAVEALQERGFAMRWARDGEDFVLRDAGCPFERLSVEHREVCCLDLEIMRRVIGAGVVREQWRREGSGACTFRVSDPGGP